MGKLRNLVRIFLGIDDTQSPEGQIKYLQDTARTNKIMKINEDSLPYFIETIKLKHEIEEISLFKDGVIIFSSEKDRLNKVNDLHDIFIKAKEHAGEKILMIKDDLWITISESNNFVFVIKKHTKVSEIELNAIIFDTIRRLDKILIEEKTLAQNIYSIENKV